VNYLVENLLKIYTPHHSQIQWLIMRYFSRSGYEARTEKEVWRNQKGRNVTERKSRVFPRECVCPKGELFGRDRG
jgi:hypothetical protein